MNEEIMNLIRSKGLFLEKEIYDALESLDDIGVVKGLLENLERASKQKMITKTSLVKNFEYVMEAVDKLPGDVKDSVEKIFIKLGISLEVHKELGVSENKRAISEEDSKEQHYNIFYSTHDNSKKIEVSDFVGHFRSRYQFMQGVLMSRPNINNLVSINKINSGSRQSFSIIGIVTEKRITKNKNLIVKFEDLTGEITALAKLGTECFMEATELQLDDVVAIKCSGDRDMVFIREVIYPESMLLEKTRFNKEDCVAFVSDIHVGSKKHLGEEFLKFIQWLKSDNDLAKKIKYLFFVGDNVDGVGVFPGQEKTLELTELKSQYEKLANYLKDVPKNITMFMCPGQHDSVRVPEPQPVIDDYYGKALHEIENLILVSNPTMVELLEKDAGSEDKTFRVLMYHGASIHTLINEIEELRLMKAHSCPAKAVKHMLKRRHLAPTHSSVVYVPNAEKDPLIIEKVPDVLCTGEVHRLDLERYNGVLIITGSCWQSQTDFEEKIGNIPDPCKVPVLNLKTQEVKILDFGIYSGPQNLISREEAPDLLRKK